MYLLLPFVQYSLISLKWTTTLLYFSRDLKKRDKMEPLYKVICSLATADEKYLPQYRSPHNLQDNMSRVSYTYNLFGL